MMRLLKRLIRPSVDSSQSVVTRKRRSSASAPEVGEPIPVPEVVEGDGGEADWSLWEDSVLSSESQLQTLAASTSVSHEKTQPLSRDELTAYASSRRSEIN